MEWYKTLDLHVRINVKSCCELLTSVSFEQLNLLFTLREKIDILHNKLKMEGFI